MLLGALMFPGCGRAFRVAPRGPGCALAVPTRRGVADGAGSREAARDWRTADARERAPAVSAVAAPAIGASLYSDG